MKQELWRPSEQVLHLLTTECKQPAVQWEQQIQIPSSPNPSLGLAVCSRRQAPAVWRPPVAMKANCPPPAGGPVDEWQLPEEQAKVVPDAFGFLDDRPRDAERNDSNVSDGSDEADEVDEQEEEDDPPASTSAQIFDLVANRDPPPPLFMKQTTLFSGLGSVSFGSGGGFSMPASSSSIFAHSPGFGVVSLKDDEHQQHAEKEDEQDMDRDQVKSEQKMVRPRRLQRPTCTGTLSEKGSSESQTGNGKSFKPSELNGKSLVDGSPAGSTPSGSKDDHGKTSGRKPRTRPLDMLMNAIKVTAPNSGSPHQQQQRQEIQAPQTRSSSRINKNRKNSEQQDVNNTTNPNSKRAYFAHTGSWIVQKKSSRIARSAFKREEEVQPAVSRRMKVASNGKGVTKKRSLTEMSQDTQGPQKRRKKVVDGGNEEEDGDDRQKRRSVDELGVQSKRGRCPVLPTRLQDSLMNKVKRTSRK